MDYHEIPARFWSKVRKTPSCWSWAGNITGPHRTTRRGEGYGRFTPMFTTHRLAYELEKGPIPEGLLVMHTCDNRACVNPSHLVLGTYSDNTRDMIAKGRLSNGRRSNAAKLTETKVRLIRQRLNEGHPQNRIARELGVFRTTVTQIATGKTWKHITEPTLIPRLHWSKQGLCISCNLHHNAKPSNTCQEQSHHEAYARQVQRSRDNWARKRVNN